MSLGTQIIGVITDMETAESLARRYADLDPFHIKRTENVWASSSINDGFVQSSSDCVIGERLVDMPLEEQIFLAARSFLKLRPFEFLTKPRHEHGLHRISMKPLLEGIWPNEHVDVLDHIRYQLSLRTGSRILEAPTAASPTALHDGAPSDTLNHNDDDDGISPDEDELDPGYWRT